MPPTPISTSRPPASFAAARSTAVDGASNGAPDKPPASVAAADFGNRHDGCHRQACGRIDPCWQTRRTRCDGCFRSAGNVVVIDEEFRISALEQDNTQRIVGLHQADQLLEFEVVSGSSRLIGGLRNVTRQ